VTPVEPSLAAFRVPVDRRVFAPGFDLWLRLEKPFRRLWRAVINLPDRGPAAASDDLSPEYFRFPPF
jgi:hypothetical protein